MLALEAGGERVHPAVAAAFPGEHLEQPVVVPARPAGAGRLASSTPLSVEACSSVHHTWPSSRHTITCRYSMSPTRSRSVGSTVTTWQPSQPAAVPVVDHLVRVRPGPGRAVPAQPGRHRLRIAEQHHRGPPAAPAHGRLLEGVAEHRDQPAVRRDDGGAEVGAADPEGVGVPRPGQVLDLVRRLDVDDHTGSRWIGQLMHRGPPRPRPSSPPGTSSTSIPCRRRNVLVVTLRS